MTTNQDVAGSKSAEDLRAFFSRNAEANLQLLKRASAVFWEGARAFGDRSAPIQKPGALINRLVELNLSYYTLLSKHALAFGEEFTTLAERAWGTKPAAGVSAEEAAASTVAEVISPPHFEIKLEARMGEIAAATFLVKNNQPQSLTVSFEASEIISRGGGLIRSPVIRFKPPQVLIQPGAQTTVTALIDISPEFKVGELYLLKIRLVGFEQKEVLIGIQILPPAPAPASKVRAKKTSGPKKNKRPRKAR